MFFTLRVIWMFLWEVFMGKDDYKTVMKKDKRRIVMFILLFVLLGYSIFVTKRLVQIGHQYVTMENQMEAIGCLDNSVKKSDKVIEQTHKTVEEKQKQKVEVTKPLVEKKITLKNGSTVFDQKPTVETKPTPQPKTNTTKNKSHYNRKNELINSLD